MKQVLTNYKSFINEYMMKIIHAHNATIRLVRNYKLVAYKETISLQLNEEGGLKNGPIHEVKKEEITLNKGKRYIGMDDKDDPVIGYTQALYEDWHLLPIQYEVDQSEYIPTGDSFRIEVAYDGVLPTFLAKQVKVVYLTKDNQDVWVNALESVTDTLNGVIVATLPEEAVRVSFAINKGWYSHFTQRFADEYPVWTIAQTKMDSNVQALLNAFGIELEEVEEFLYWAMRNASILNADTSQISFAYEYDYGNYDTLGRDPNFTIIEQQNGTELKPIRHIKDFMQNKLHGGYLIDRAKRVILTRMDYGELSFTNSTDQEMITPRIHQIWNSFDELGMLLNVPRLPEEINNEAYKERILDVFRYPANATKMGILNGIALETGKRHRYIWQDDRKDFLIKFADSKEAVNFNANRIIEESLHINHEPVDSSMYTKRDDGSYLIHRRGFGESHIVTFLTDGLLYELHDKDNPEFYPLLFNADGSATRRLYYWKEQIELLSPIFWGQISWDKHYWDTINTEGNGLGFIPHMYDSDISVWK